MSEATLDVVRRRIKAARRRAHVELRERASFETAPNDDRAAADALTRSLGFRTLGPHWVALSAEQGYQVAYEVLWRDLAYLEEIMDREAAEDLARGFLAHFDAHARFFTNFICLDPTFRVGGNSEGWPVTEETAETGIVVVDQLRVGMLWVEDPD